MYEEIPPLPREHNIGADAFKERYLLPRKPVVLTGLMDNLPLMERWSFDFFRERFGDMGVSAMAYMAGFRSPRRRELSLREYLEWIASDNWRADWFEGYPAPYLERWMVFDPLLGNRHDLDADYTIPLHFQNHARFLPRWMHAGFVLQVFIGPAGTVAWLHQDLYMVHSWHVNVRGSKRWLLFHPDQSEHLHETGGVSEVDIENPDLERHPNFRKARPTYQLNQQPGDLIFIPCGWWHQVRSLTPCLSLGGSFTDATTTGRYLRELVRSVPRTLRQMIQTQNHQEG